MRLFFISLFIVISVFFACKDEINYPSQDPTLPVPYVEVFSPCDTSEGGVAQAIKINSTWTASAKAWSYNNSGVKYWKIELTTCNQNGEIREHVTFARIPDSHPEQHFLLTRQGYAPDGYAVPVYARLTSDGDVLDDLYYLDTLAVTDYLIIDKWDTLNKQIEGRFRASFDIRQPRNNPDNPEKVKFWKGNFRLPLRE